MKLLLITGPSGSGKTTLKNNLIQHYSDKYSNVILNTSRNKRVNGNGEFIEKNGVDYNFMQQDDFRDANFFLQFGKYGLLQNEWDKALLNTKVNVLSCGDYLANFFIKYGLLELYIIFMDTSLQECYRRMLMERGNREDIEKRVKIYDSEYRIKEKADLIVEPVYTIKEVNDRIDRIMRGIS